MPVRYTRKLKPTLLTGELLIKHSNELVGFIKESARCSMSESNGWTVHDSHEGDDLLNQEYGYGDFKGTLSVSSGVDLTSVRGEGMLRSPYLMISVTSQDKRKVDSQLAETEIVQGFEKIFSIIGSIAVGLVGVFFQVEILDVIFLEVTFGCFVVGFFLGGFIGYMFGEPISAFLTSKSKVKTEDDHVDLGVARGEWSYFIDSIIEPIEVFSKLVEETPSSVTII